MARANKTKKICVVSFFLTAFLLAAQANAFTVGRGECATGRNIPQYVAQLSEVVYSGGKEVGVKPLPALNSIHYKGFIQLNSPAVWKVFGNEKVTFIKVVRDDYQCITTKQYTKNFEAGGQQYYGYEFEYDRLCQTCSGAHSNIVFRMGSTSGSCVDFVASIDCKAEMLLVTRLDDSRRNGLRLKDFKNELLGYIETQAREGRRVKLVDLNDAETNSFYGLLHEVRQNQELDKDQVKGSVRVLLSKITPDYLVLLGSERVVPKPLKVIGGEWVFSDRLFANDDGSNKFNSKTLVVSRIPSYTDTTNPTAPVENADLIKQTLLKAQSARQFMQTSLLTDACGLYDAGTAPADQQVAAIQRYVRVQKTIRGKTWYGLCGQLMVADALIPELFPWCKTERKTGRACKCEDLKECATAPPSCATIGQAACSLDSLKNFVENAELLYVNSHSTYVPIEKGGKDIGKMLALAYVTNTPHAAIEDLYPTTGKKGVKMTGLLVGIIMSPLFVFQQIKFKKPAVVIVGSCLAADDSREAKPDSSNVLSFFLKGSIVLLASTKEVNYNLQDLVDLAGDRRKLNNFVEYHVIKEAQAGKTLGKAFAEGTSKFTALMKQKKHRINEYIANAIGFSYYGDPTVVVKFAG